MRSRVLASALAAICLIGLSAFLLRPRPEPVSASRQPDPPARPAPPPSDPPDEQAKTDRADESSVILFGAVVPAERAALSVRMPIRIAAVLVRRGDTVRRGQLLVELDAADAHAQLEGAQAAVHAAEAQLGKARTGREAQLTKALSEVDAALAGRQQAEAREQQAALARNAAHDDNLADLAGAKESLKKAEAAQERAGNTVEQLEELAKVGGVSRSDLDAARMQSAAALSDVEAARVQVRRLEAGPKGERAAPYRVALAQKDVEAAMLSRRQAHDAWLTARHAQQQISAVADQDVRAAEAALAQAQAGLNAARLAVDQTRLTSPIEGVAAAVDARTGETAQPGLSLVSIVSLHGQGADALAPARQISRLRIGQPCVVTAETEPGRHFPAFINTIARVAEPDGRTFRVTFRFRTAVALRPDQSVRISVATR